MRGPNRPANMSSISIHKLESLKLSVIPRDRPTVHAAETYGFPTNAIVSMAEVTEHLYNRECQGRVVINDTIKTAIDEYYKQYGCK